MSSEEKSRRNHEHYLKNRDKILLQVHDYQKKNRKVVLRKKKAYNAAHAEQRNEEAKAYYLENREQKRSYDREYYGEKGEQIREHVVEMANIKKLDQREKLGEVFVLKCYFCGDLDPMSRHGVSFHKKDGQPHNYHAIQRNQYILEHPDEFVPLCRFCHNSVSAVMAMGFVWEEIDKLFTNKRKELGEEKMRKLKLDLQARLQKRGKWLNDEEGGE